MAEDLEMVVISYRIPKWVGDAWRQRCAHLSLTKEQALAGLMVAAAKALDDSFLFLNAGVAYRQIPESSVPYDRIRAGLAAEMGEDGPAGDQPDRTGKRRPAKRR